MRPVHRASLALIILAAIGCSGPASSPGSPTRNLSTSLEDLDMGGEPTASFDIVADGPWTATSSDAWLQVSPTVGAGPTTVTVTAHRRGLTPGAHAAAVTITSADQEVSVRVGSRFPTIDVSAARHTEVNLEAAGSISDRSVLSSDVDHHPSELVVTLKPFGPGAAPSHVRDLLGAVARDHGAAIVRGASTGTRAIATLRIAGDVGKAAQRLARDPRVADVSPNVRLDLLGSEPLSNEQAWHYEAISLENAWALTGGAPEVTVAVIDSGFDLLHEDLHTNLAAGHDFGDRDSDAHSDGLACGDHGTHVAGTIGAPLNGLGGTGVSPAVTMVPLKIGTYNASTGVCEIWSSSLLAAIYHAAGAEVYGAARLERPVDVINMSLGGPSYNTALHEAVRFAAAEGVTLVAASGNGGDGRILFPAAHPEVIAVGASNARSERTAYSSYGPELDVMAPGGEGSFSVTSARWSDTHDSYGAMQGTSMAAPHVAGVVALMKSVNPALTPQALQDLLQSSARDIGEDGPDELTGFGIVDAETAVQAAHGYMTNDDTLTFRLHALNEDGDWQVAAEWSGVSTLRYGDAAFTSYRAEVGIDADADGTLGEPGEWFGHETFDLSPDRGDWSTTVRMALQ